MGQRGNASPPPPRPSLMHSKNYFVEIIQFLFYFLTKSIWNVFLRLLERLKCKILKPWSVPYPELFWSRYTGLGSQTQTPKLSKVLISGISFRHRLLSQSHESDVLSLFRMQNSQNFQGLCPWTPLGRAYSTLQTNQLHNGFSPRYACRKTGNPKKLLDTALMMVAVIYCCNNKVLAPPLLQIHRGPWSNKLRSS